MYDRISGRTVLGQSCCTELSPFLRVKVIMFKKMCEIKSQFLILLCVFWAANATKWFFFLIKFVIMDI